MITWKATIKEKNNEHILTPEYLVPDDVAHDYIDEKYLIDFWGLENDDVEWYKIEKVS
jgi:hypothetical protein